jgi:hypothetical protein
MMKVQEVYALEGEDPATSIVEQDEVLLLWNNQQASYCIWHASAKQC